jgi:cytochrome c-type biogenesis protein CcmH
MRLAALLLPLLLFAGDAFAQPATPDAPLLFRDAAEEARFRALATELRCVMCQNQSLADSNAQIARDLRGEILQLMRRGQSDAQIEQYLVARYGEFVLYKPRVEERTWLLWFGPALVLLAGAAVVVAIVRRRSRATIADDEAQEW